MIPEYLRARLARFATYGVLAMDMEQYIRCALLAPPELDAGPDARVHPNTERAVAGKPGSVAVIPFSGVVVPRETPQSRYYGETGSADLVDRVRAAVNDKGVKAIVIHVDSPGGAVAGTQEAAEELATLRGTKPIVAHANFLMASAAYWLASQADEIVASPSALVGSVGVIAHHMDYSGLLAKFGMQPTIFAQPAMKSDGSPLVPLTDTAREEFGNIVNAAYDTFAGAVSSARGVTRDAIAKSWAHVYTSAHALDNGMIDKVRPLNQSVAVYLGSQSAPMARMAREIDFRRKSEGKPL